MQIELNFLNNLMFIRKYNFLMLNRHQAIPKTFKLVLINKRGYAELIFLLLS